MTGQQDRGRVAGEVRREEWTSDSQMERTESFTLWHGADDPRPEPPQLAAFGVTAEVWGGEARPQNRIPIGSDFVGGAFDALAPQLPVDRAVWMTSPTELKSTGDPMIEPFTPRVGGILSADIAVPQHEQVVRFYARVLGTGETPFWREDLMNNRGMPVIGLGARSPEFAGLPLQWMPHIQVADIARSVERALALGGSELMHGKRDDGTSQWAVLLDPNGAAFGLIPVVSRDELPSGEGEPSSAAAQGVGCISWIDLTVAEASTTRDFYREVIGWSVQDIAMEDSGERYADYCMLGDDGKPAAGVCHARGVNVGVPPIWMLYLPVGDLAASLRHVQGEGGRVLKDSSGGAGGHAYAIIQDPVGARLGLVPG